MQMAHLFQDTKNQRLMISLNKHKSSVSQKSYNKKFEDKIAKINKY
jgi:hypothetical protein